MYIGHDIYLSWFGFDIHLTERLAFQFIPPDVEIDHESVRISCEYFISLLLDTKK